MRNFLLAVLIVAGAIVAGRWSADGREATAAVGNGEPLATVEAPTPPPTPTLTHDGAQRVQFAVGTYGTTLQVNGQTTFVLWAAQGQTFTVAGADGTIARLTAAGGSDIALVNGSAVLPASSDYLLTVGGVDAVAVDIR